MIILNHSVLVIMSKIMQYFKYIKCYLYQTLCNILNVKHWSLCQKLYKNYVKNYVKNYAIFYVDMIYYIINKYINTVL